MKTNKKGIELTLGTVIIAIIVIIVFVSHSSFPGLARSQQSLIDDYFPPAMGSNENAFSSAFHTSSTLVLSA